MRISIMRRTMALLGACCLGLAGCGGGDDGGGGFFVGTGSVSGVIFDQNGVVVRNAQVFYNDGGQSPQFSTMSNSNGAYVLRHIPALDDVIQCQIVSNGVSYFGQNLARLNSGQRTMTVNIGLYPETQLATLKGTVGDNFGNLLFGAKVYAIPASGPTLTSAYGITDFSGHYNISGLLAGTAYTIQVNALGYGSAADSETLTAGQAKTINYTLPPAINTTLATPTGVKAIAYTSPGESTTSPRFHNAIQAIKNITHPGLRMRPANKKPQVSNGGSPIEVDVLWNPISNPSLLGFGIYRSAFSQPLASLDFLSDPLASAYEDMDSQMTSGTTYNYAVTTISTSYNGRTGESAQSSVVSATPLGPLTLGSVTSSTNPTFNWTAATGAANYAVFLFGQYPDIGVTDIFDNFATPSPGTSYTYSGAALTSGRTYYFIVVGISSTGDQSVSQVGQFTVP